MYIKPAMHLLIPYKNRMCLFMVEIIIELNFNALNYLER